MNPIVDIALDAEGVLTFENAAVHAGTAAAPEGYRVTWYAYDNATARTALLGRNTIDSTQRALLLPDLPVAAAAFVRIDVSAVNPPHATWAEPLRAHFKRTIAGWTLVGLSRSAR